MIDVSNNIVTTQPKIEDNIEDNIEDILANNNVGVRIKPETIGNKVIINLCACLIIFSK